MARGGIRNGPRKFERQQTPDQLWPETLKLYWADDVDRLRSSRDVSSISGLKEFRTVPALHNTAARDDTVQTVSEHPQ